MAKKIKRTRNVRPDAVDFRDLPFRPVIGLTPAPTLFPKLQLAVKNQGETSACTGFSLSLVVEYLLRKARRENAAISPYMLYSMARRYDEFPGSADEGSSLRGALKGWFKHGACGDRMWRTGVAMPATPNTASEDWWLDAVRRPLGAYYRIDAKNIRDIHAALNEVGIVYASAVCHANWDLGYRVTPLKTRPRSFRSRLWTIPPKKGASDDGGHAVAFVGYNAQGFVLQNSWDRDWGSYGYAILTYDDWLDNAMDCWVAQLGVVTEEHRAIAEHTTLRTDAKGRVQLASDLVLRDREISPFVINMGDSGRLSNSGTFRTREADVKDIVDLHLARARELWRLHNRPLDVCVYVHGGLVPEKHAARSAAQWIPLLYNEGVFPIFMMWATDFLSTVITKVENAVGSMPSVVDARGARSYAEQWWNERLERTLAPIGTPLWREMKRNAAQISEAEHSGAVLLFSHFMASRQAKQPLRIHLLGHSAGCIVLAHMIDAGIQLDLTFESVTFMAPALRVDAFENLVLPHVESGKIGRYLQLHLSDKAEEDDPSCGPYKRSLLYLVSESFEGGMRKPILGMQRYFGPRFGAHRKLAHIVAPGVESAASTHADFDDDALTRQRVLQFIQRG